MAEHLDFFQTVSLHQSFGSARLHHCCSSSTLPNRPRVWSSDLLIHWALTYIAVIMRCVPLAGLLWLLLLSCCGSNASIQSDTHADAEKRHVKADTVHQWLVGVTEDATVPQINDASQFLATLINMTPNQVLRSDGLFLFWAVNMTAAQRDQALSHPHIRMADLDLKLVDTRVLPVRSSQPNERRAGDDTVTYEIQPLAAAELTAISQPRYAITLCLAAHMTQGPVTDLLSLPGVSRTLTSSRTTYMRATQEARTSSTMSSTAWLFAGTQR